MTDPISHFGRMAQMDSNVRQAAKAEKRPAANEQALAPQSAGTAPVRQDDEVQLSQVARQAMQEPEFDRAKVEVTEMVEMMAAARSYQNNVEVINTARQLMLRTLDITKS